MPGSTMLQQAAILPADDHDCGLLYGIHPEGTVEEIRRVGTSHGGQHPQGHDIKRNSSGS